MTDAPDPPERPPPDPDAWIRTHRLTYERMAPDYARRIDDYAAADEAERFTHLAAPNPWTAPRILDAGCGPGRDAALLRLAGAEVVGLDLARAMLHQARRLDDAGHLCQGDLRRLPFPSGAFDALWCFAALGHLPPPAIPHALTEFHRVLKNGWLYIVIRQGAGVRTTSWQGSLPRHFTDLTPDGLADALHTANFTIHHQTTHPTPTQTPWLHTIARSG
ncbi:MAG: class I SAM-dependent methyltransferase [Chloroflexota bacterium]|nr:class I SAM-dependent methyltransferase [Chloroflexota bacterium]